MESPRCVSCERRGQKRYIELEDSKSFQRVILKSEQHEEGTVLEKTSLFHSNRSLRHTSIKQSPVTADEIDLLVIGLFCHSLFRVEEMLTIYSQRKDSIDVERKTSGNREG